MRFHICTKASEDVLGLFLIAQDRVNQRKGRAQSGRKGGEGIFIAIANSAREVHIDLVRQVDSGAPSLFRGGGILRVT